MDGKTVTYQGNKIQKSAAAVKRLYTLSEAARYLGWSEWGMGDLIWAGKIPVVREKGGRKIFIDIHELVAYVERNRAVYHWWTSVPLT